MGSASQTLHNMSCLLDYQEESTGPDGTPAAEHDDDAEAQG